MKRYRPERMTVTVMGDIGDQAEVELMFSMIEKKFGSFTGGSSSNYYKVKPGVLPDYFQRAKNRLLLLLFFFSFFSWLID
jgi:predicted Zn-dependent peptidase